MSRDDDKKDKSMEIQALDAKIASWEALERRVLENIQAAPSIITLDVGGTLFRTSKSTLLSVEGTYFHAMLGSGLWQPHGPNSTYFLDLDPLTFHHIMAYLRTGTKVLNDWEKTQLQVCREHSIALTWDPPAVSPGLYLFQENRGIQTSGTYGWMTAKGTVANPPVFRVQVDARADDTFIGLAPASNPEKTGYFIRLKNGQLRGPRANMSSNYQASGFKSSDILTVRYEGGDISFAKNNQELGVAFTVENKPSRSFHSCLRLLWPRSFSLTRCDEQRLNSNCLLR
ncbi:hypothetical protein AC1031_002680 [Aphanomyces cochlioides]|nr:hypothetical protein AC1031_002680 [Aphanomyces cochlioides]